MLRFLIVVTIATLCRVENAVAQFSPGDLARAHEKLEGMNHCADCHEVGKEIGAVLQLPVVGDPAPQLDPEPESGGHAVLPPAHQAGRRNPVEGVVQLDGVEAAGIVVQPSGRGYARRIEHIPPV